MSGINDGVLKLRALADSDDIPTRMLDDALRTLENVPSRIADALPAESQHLPTLQGLVEVAKESILSATNACVNLIDGLNIAADAHARG